MKKPIIKTHCPDKDCDGVMIGPFLSPGKPPEYGKWSVRKCLKCGMMSHTLLTIGEDTGHSNPSLHSRGIGLVGYSKR